MTDHQFDFLNEKLNTLWQAVCSIVDRLDAQSAAMTTAVHSGYWDEYAKQFGKYSSKQIFKEDE